MSRDADTASHLDSSKSAADDANRVGMRPDVIAARKEIIAAAAPEHHVAYHEEVIAFCGEHELVEQARVLIDRLSEEYSHLASFHNELHTLFTDISSDKFQLSKSSGSHGVKADEQSDAASGSAVTPEADGESMSAKVAGETQRNLATETRLVHSGMRSVTDGFATYCDKVVKDALDAQRVADRTLKAYQSTRRKAQRHARRLIAAEATSNVDQSEDANAPQSGFAGSSRFGTRPGGIRKWLSSETESETECESSGSASEAEQELEARLKLTLAAELKSRSNAFDAARSGALTKLRLASDYRTRVTQHSFTLLTSLHRVYYCTASSDSCNWKETLLKSVLRENLAVLHNDSSNEVDGKKSNRKPALVFSVVSLLTPSIRDAVKSLARRHRRAVSTASHNSVYSLPLATPNAASAISDIATKSTTVTSGKRREQSSRTKPNMQHSLDLADAAQRLKAAAADADMASL